MPAIPRALGLEALGRAGAISLFVFSVSFVFIIVTMLSKLDLNNFSPVFYDGAGRVISAGQTMAVRTIEPAAMAVLFPRVSGNKKKRLFYMGVGTCGVFGNCVFLRFFGTRRLCHDPAFPDTFNSRAVRIQRFFSVLT